MSGEVSNRTSFPREIISSEETSAGTKNYQSIIREPSIANYDTYKFKLNTGENSKLIRPTKLLDESHSPSHGIVRAEAAIVSGEPSVKTPTKSGSPLLEMPPFQLKQQPQSSTEPYGYMDTWPGSVELYKKSIEASRQAAESDENSIEPDSLNIQSLRSEWQSSPTTEVSSIEFHKYTSAPNYHANSNGATVNTSRTEVIRDENVPEPIASQVEESSTHITYRRFSSTFRNMLPSDAFLDSSEVSVAQQLTHEEKYVITVPPEHRKPFLAHDGNRGPIITEATDFGRQDSPKTSSVTIEELDDDIIFTPESNGSAQNNEDKGFDLYRPNSRIPRAEESEELVTPHPVPRLSKADPELDESFVQWLQDHGFKVVDGCPVEDTGSQNHNKKRSSWEYVFEDGSEDMISTEPESTNYTSSMKPFKYVEKPLEKDKALHPVDVNLENVYSAALAILDDGIESLQADLEQVNMSQTALQALNGSKTDAKNLEPDSEQDAFLVQADVALVGMSADLENLTSTVEQVAQKTNIQEPNDLIEAKTSPSIGADLLTSPDTEEATTSSLACDLTEVASSSSVALAKLISTEDEYDLESLMREGTMSELPHAESSQDIIKMGYSNLKQWYLRSASSPASLELRAATASQNLSLWKSDLTNNEQNLEKNRNKSHSDDDSVKSSEPNNGVKMEPSFILDAYDNESKFENLYTEALEKYPEASWLSLAEGGTKGNVNTQLKVHPSDECGGEDELLEDHREFGRDTPKTDDIGTHVLTGIQHPIEAEEECVAIAATSITSDSDESLRSSDSENRELVELEFSTVGLDEEETVFVKTSSYNDILQNTPLETECQSMPAPPPRPSLSSDNIGPESSSLNNKQSVQNNRNPMCDKNDSTETSYFTSEKEVQTSPTETLGNFLFPPEPVCTCRRSFKEGSETPTLESKAPLSPPHARSVQVEEEICPLPAEDSVPMPAPSEQIQTEQPRAGSQPGESSDPPPNALAPDRMTMLCPHCGNTVVTTTVRKPSWSYSWCIAPLFVDRMKDVEHWCPECLQIIGKYTWSPCQKK